VLAAQGRAFCAGHDLKEMRAQPSLEYYRALFAQCTRMMLTLRRLPVPVIARVQGIATAAGCQLVAQCDLAVASSAARFAVSGVNLGLFCSTPSVPLIRNVARKPAFEMLVTGDFIDAAQAQARGLVNRVVEPERLDAEIETVAAETPGDVALAVDVMIPMRDGAALAADVYRPARDGVPIEGRFPALLMRTPYNKEVRAAPFARYFASRGYVVVVQDVRGRYRSQGRWRPLSDDGRDGYDTTQWIGHHSWSDGGIGTVGTSYEGGTQHALAI